MKIRLGTAPDSWGVWFADDPKQVPWRRFLDEAVTAGYEWIELGPHGYLPTDPEMLRQELESRGLKATGSFVMASLEDPALWPAIEERVLSFGELLATLEARFLVVIDDLYTDPFTGAAVLPKHLDAPSWKRLIETTHKIAEITREKFGLKVAFHPHSDTHVEKEDQIEAFLEQTDPKLVSLCLDTGHHAYQGGDPIGFYRRHHERIVYLHLKSVDRKLREKVERENIPFATAVGLGVFCEPAAGVVNFPSLMDALRECNFDSWAIVEQDMYPAPFDKPFPIAKRTRAYLRKIGMA